MDTSQLKMWSFGYAAENKTLESYFLEVFPVEKLPYVEGEITSARGTIEDAGVNAAGENYTVKIELSNCVRCRWLPWGSNRLYPPDIRRGERVEIYRFGDTDEYYWKELGLDDYLRRKETVIYVFSNTSDETVTQLTPENSYSVEVSTHTKQITIRTNKNDGEPFAWIVQLNTKEGFFTVTDDIGNLVQINSLERLVQLINADGSYHKVNKKDLISYAPNDMEVTVGNNIDMQAGKNINIKGGLSTVIEGAISKIELNAAHAMMTNGVAKVDLVGPAVISN